jgi:hypothetical protein
MNVLQDILTAGGVWLDALRQLLAAHPLVQSGLEAVALAVPLAALAAFAGLGFVSGAARLLAVTRRRVSYEKCARQLALLALTLGWPLLVGSRIWLFFTHGSYTPDSLPAFMAEMAWILLGLAVLVSSLYFSLWKFLPKLPVLHAALGIISGIQGWLALAATLAAARLLAAFALPEAANLTLGGLFLPGWLSPFWCALYATLPLALGLAGGTGALWLALRRRRDDFGRDHYNAMIPWCAVWASRAWTLFWLALLLSSGLAVYARWQGGVFTTGNALWESARLLLWLLPAVLWAVVCRSAAPLRHKPALLAALLAAMTCLPFYATAVTSIALP